MKKKNEGILDARRDYTVIENTDFSERVLPEEEYELTEFRNCTFSSISGLSFVDCAFVKCNLSNANVGNTKLQDVVFVECKLLGVHFYQAKQFGFGIGADSCILDYASFDKLKLQDSEFRNCRMASVNFTRADLSKVKLTSCDFRDALFSATNLTGVDFTTSYNFTIDPVINTVKKAKFLAHNLSGLLTTFGIVIQ